VKRLPALKRRRVVYLLLSRAPSALPESRAAPNTAIAGAAKQAGGAVLRLGEGQAEGLPRDFGPGARSRAFSRTSHKALQALRQPDFSASADAQITEMSDDLPFI
jgi:hypothetical protein